MGSSFMRSGIPESQDKWVFFLEYEMSKGEKVKWYLRPVNVVLSLFFVLGLFGLPLLYKSPRFSRTSKIILTILNLFAAFKAWGRFVGIITISPSLRWSGFPETEI